MSKEDSIEVTGTVLEKFPSGLFSVQLEHDRVVLAHLAGRLRRNRIRVLAGELQKGLCGDWFTAWTRFFSSPRTPLAKLLGAKLKPAL